MNATPHWLHEPALQQFFASTRAAGGEARAVGGAVRDFLLGIEAQDIDLATSLTPDATIGIANAQGWKAIPTGLAHGTVTLVLPTRVVEVTTLRRDVETDGRHATVAFTDRFEEDAARRDFTFNALYMDAQGRIADFFDGQQDLHARTVRFIGDAATRIQEDGLRILRYFRFLARFGTREVEAATLAALAAHKDMLAALSGERIAVEMHRLLAASNPLHALTWMAHIDLAPLLTNHGWQPTGCAGLLVLESRYHLHVSGWARLLAMIDPASRLVAAQWISERWKLSRAERAELELLAQPVELPTSQLVKEWLRHLPRALVEARVALALVEQEPSEQASALFGLVQQWPVPKFDISARDLMAYGFAPGVALGEALRALEAQWVVSDYQLDKETLLATVTRPIST